MEIQIRPIAPGDNHTLARIIRDSLAEFGANKPGTVYYDPTTDHLYELFREPRSGYFVAEQDGQLLGGAGIFPTAGLPADTCELVKMYLAPAARGKGLGRRLVDYSMEQARSLGFAQVYLETMPELQQALAMYARLGFQYIDHPMGNSGHTGCSLWMLRTL
ncbi:MAG: GNAT family N-acetyltransferase [Chitinophagaceae bacterium]